MTTCPRAVSLLIVTVLVSSLSGCSLLSRGPRVAPRMTDGANADYAAELDALVKRDLRSSRNHDSLGSAQLIGKKPDFFREYVQYPNGEDDFQVEIHERDSLSAPYRASVRVSKIRYATPVEHRRDAARRETHFVKSSGTETISYEYRSGQWHRMGSFFVADTSEIQVGDEWRAVDTSSISTEGVSSENKKRGFWGRSWSRFKFWRR